MKTIVIALLVIMLMRIGARAAVLMFREYPRTVTWKKSEDVSGLIVSILVAAWCGWALLQA